VTEFGNETLNSIQVGENGDRSDTHTHTHSHTHAESRKGDPEREKDGNVHAQS
jgi:hypothetical protein